MGIEPIHEWVLNPFVMSKNAVIFTVWTSGIPGGYRLVSTYDLPGCKTNLKFEIWSFSDFWGGILKLSDLDSVTIFIWGGVGWGILKLSDLDSVTIFIWGGVGWDILKLSDLDSVTIFILGGILKLSDLDYVTIFILGGILKLSDLDSVTIFIWGGILKLSDLDSLTIFIGGGYSETLGFGLYDNFHLGGMLKL